MPDIQATRYQIYRMKRLLFFHYLSSKKVRLQGFLYTLRHVQEGMFRYIHKTCSKDKSIDIT